MSGCPIPALSAVTTPTDTPARPLTKGRVNLFQRRVRTVAETSQGRTWALRGKTRSSGPLDVAAPSVGGRAHRLPAGRPHPHARPAHDHRGRKGEPKDFREEHFAALLDATHQQLGGPITVARDGLPAHNSAKMRAWIASRHCPQAHQWRLAPERDPCGPH